jgi:hypothetical protein
MTTEQFKRAKRIMELLELLENRINYLKRLAAKASLDYTSFRTEVKGIFDLDYNYFIEYVNQANNTLKAKKTMLLKEFEAL